MKNPFESLASASVEKKLEIANKISDLKNAKRGEEKNDNVINKGESFTKWLNLHQEDCAEEPEKEDLYPVTSSQLRLWYLSQISDIHSIAYNIPVALRINGDLNVDKLKQSLNKLVKRHSCLRTRFPISGGMPSQCIIQQHQPAFSQSVKTQEEVMDYIHQQVKVTFDLEDGPPFRVELVKLSNNEHILLICFHHIIADGWSVSILVRDLFSFFTDEKTLGLTPLNVGYQDYSRWQNSSSYKKRTTKSNQYWIEKLTPVPERLNLCFERSMLTENRSYNGDSIDFKIDIEDFARLNQFAAQNEITLYMLVLAAFKLLLFQYSGQSDIAVGSPVANRISSDLENIVGLFANTVVVRSSIDGQLRVKEFLAQLKCTVLSDFTHKCFSFEEVVEQLNPERSRMFNPIFQYMFVMQNSPRESLHTPDFSWKLLECDTKVSKFDMSLILTETSDGLQGALEFSTELYEVQHVQRFIEGYQYLLRKIVDLADEKIHSLPTLLEEEQDELAAWNQTYQKWETDKTVVDLFERQVRMRPDAVALRFVTMDVCYRQLDERANKIAHYLIAKGVKTNQRVAVYLERSPDMVAGILGIAKAGAAYVPLDNSYPKGRLNFMLDDSNAVCLLSHSKLPQLNFSSHRTLYLDSWQSDDVSPRTPNRDHLLHNLAYVIYTSGSTGKPKGVIVNHRSLYNRIIWMQKEFDIGPTERIIQKTPLSFDVSVWEVFLPLVTGATMVLLEHDKHKDPDYLYEVMQKESVSICHFVPAMLRSFLQSRQHFDLNSLNTVFCSGEELTVSLLNHFYKQIDAQLINLYGPTECTVDVSYWICDPHHDGSFVPIGQPIANTQLYVLNHDLKALPPGYVGELYIAGEGLALGYLNRPELTSEKFVDNPFESDKRLYRTGDKAKFLHDGNIVFMGRLDEQVKIRGLRIELGEIDHNLCEHPELEQAVTIIRDDVYESSESNQHIVSYIVPKSDSLLERGTLEWKQILSNHLSLFLPGFMLPDFFVTLGEIPLSPSGKVARTKLLRPKVDRLTDSVLIASTIEEVAVARMWSELLGLAYDKINIETSFFDLGGHSLLFGKLTSKMNSAFGINVSISDLFNRPTIKQQVSFIAGLDKVATSKLRKIGDSEKCAVSTGQKQMWALHNLFPDKPLYNIPFIVEIKGKLNKDALSKSLAQLINRHEILRTVYYQNERGELRSTVLQDYELPFAFHDVSDEDNSDEHLDDLLKKELDSVFDLTHSPIVKAALIKRAEEDCVFALTVHHIGCDGWSLGILADELSECYSNILRGKSVALTELPFQFTDYAVWETEWLESSEYSTSLDIWKKRLSGAPLIHNLPLDFARKNLENQAGKCFTRKLPSILYAGVKKILKINQISSFVLLHAAFSCLLHRYSGDTDIVVGTAMPNRKITDVQGLIGCFVNMLPVRSEFTSEDTFAQMLEQSKLRLLEAYDNQNVPFETIVREIANNRILTTNPLFQIIVSSDNHHKGEFAIDGAKTSLLSNHNYTAKTDLSLTLNEFEDEASLTWEYSSELFECISIERMAERFETLLSHCIQNPNAQVANIPLNEGLRFEDYENLLEHTQGVLETVIHRFEQIAKREPENIALVDENESYSYRELDERANQFAGYLQSIGVGREDIVGIHLDRSPSLVVVILAAWKAGAAFMPIDAACPEERVRYMLDNSGVSTVITDTNILQMNYQRELKCIDVSDLRICDAFQAEGSDLNTLIEPQQLACVMYTSGSTGRPKGVMIEHQQLNAMQVADMELFELDQSDRVLQFSNTSFDIFIEELIVSLGVGASLVFRDDNMLDAAGEFWAFVQKNCITIVTLPTYFWHLLCKNIDKVHIDEQLSLRLVIIGGEIALSSMWRQWYSKMGDVVRVINTYGPTETTCYSTYFDLANLVDKRGFIPIGKPRADTSCYILDQNDNLCPHGVSGELVIGGCGITRGYLNSDDNLNRFIASPFPDRKHTTLYRTGDMARLMSDGNIEFIGRCDQQIKLKGYRVNLSEVESLMLTIPQVGSAATVLSQNDKEEDVIVTYFVLNDKIHSDSLDTGNLRELIRDKLEKTLPHFMLPKFYVEVPKIPTTTSGKVDRAKLPPPTEADEMLKEPLITETEKTIATTWASLIDHDYVKFERNSNFFQLGGTSLKAVKAVRLLNEAFNLELNVKYLYQFSKLKWLAEAIDLLLKRNEVHVTRSVDDKIELDEMEI